MDRGWTALQWPAAQKAKAAQQAKTETPRFVLFLERESLGHLIALFPDDVSIGYCQAPTEDDLEHDYNVKDDKERELLMHSITKLREEFSADESDSELDNSADLHSEVFSSLPRNFKLSRSRLSDEFGDPRAKRRESFAFPSSRLDETSNLVRMRANPSLGSSEPNLTGSCSDITRRPSSFNAGTRKAGRSFTTTSSMPSASSSRPYSPFSSPFSQASKGDANSAASKVLTPQAPTAIKDTQTSGGKRKRKANKKLFDNDYITDESESVSEPAPVQKSKGNSKNKGKKNRTGEAENKHRGGEKASPAKKRKTLEEKEQELSLLSAKLTDIEENILRPVVEIDSHSSSDIELSESECSRIEEPTLLGSSTSLSGSSEDNQPKLQHPHFGGKRPKSNRPPPRCINCDCKREKQEKDHEIETLKEEVQQLQKELRMLREQNQSPNKQIEGNEGSGKMSKEQGNARGLIELVSGSGVWACANKLGAAIKDAENKSRTVLVRSLVAIFFSKEQLLSKSFSDLDKDIIEACVEFAMIAKLGKVDSVKKSQLRQALRCKVNSMKFQSSRPGYYQEYRKNYSGPKKAAKEAKEE